jgi:hypothetical protein
MAKITIVWCAFAGRWDEATEKETGRKGITRVEFEMPTTPAIDDEMICDQIYKETNTYRGNIWDQFNEQFPKDRSHTAISVGDMIGIDDRFYFCADIGWTKAYEKIVANV